MKVAVQGTDEFNDYNVFLRAMGISLSSMPAEDEYFVVYSLGPSKINSFVSEFCNISEKGLKARGKKVKFYKTTPSWIVENIQSIDYFAYLSKPNEHASRLVSFAQDNNVEIGIFKY